jgi:putative transposase
LASVRQFFQFKLFGCKRLRHLHRTIDVSSEIWNHSVALHRRYYRLFKETLPKAKLQAHLAKLRNVRRAHWKAVGSQSVQAITDRL